MNRRLGDGKNDKKEKKKSRKKNRKKGCAIKTSIIKRREKETVQYCKN